MRWTVVIPAKALPEAKSRLAPMSADADAHRRLVEAIRADTVEAARVTPQVARIVLVVDRPDAVPDTGVASVITQVAPGLNAAVREGAAAALASWPGDGVAALVGDLPALRPEELGEALQAAAGHPSAYVADAAGTGTTLLAATPGTALRPAFGPGSARRHAQHAVAIAAGHGLRRDVDTADDVDAATALGVGAATAAVLACRALPTCSP